MTRIGHYQIKSRQLCWQCFLAARQPRPAQNFPDQTTSLNISVPNIVWLCCWVGTLAVHTLATTDLQVFFEATSLSLQTDTEKTGSVTLCAHKPCPRWKAFPPRNWFCQANKIVHQQCTDRRW
jgi:hypothetical protein